MRTKNLSENPVHLGLGATAESEPTFTGSPEWYAAYIERHESDGKEARLVAQHSFSSDWKMWEMHPEGAELVVCTAGELTLVQELEGKEVETLLTQGEYAINPPGVWHTANVASSATALFVTAGWGTQHRPR